MSTSSYEVFKKIHDNISQVIIGKSSVTKLLLTCLAAGGHALLEDVPGTGKTVLARALAASMDLSFGRIQFTPDLLPSDVTGLSYFNQEEHRFIFREGPFFAIFCLQMKSTAPHRVRSPVCLNVWQKIRLQLMVLPASLTHLFL